MRKMESTQNQQLKQRRMENDGLHNEATRDQHHLAPSSVCVCVCVCVCVERERHIGTTRE